MSYTDAPFNGIIYIRIGLEDLNELKRIRGLATTRNDIYIAITSGTIADMNSNNIPSNDTQQVQYFTDDHTHPALHLDINTGTLVLNFTETIDILSLDITFQPAANVSTSNLSVTLTSGEPPLYSSTMSNDSHTILALKTSMPSNESRS